MQFLDFDFALSIAKARVATQPQSKDLESESDRIARDWTNNATKRQGKEGKEGR